MTKIWLVKRNDRVGYDDYDSMVVAADTDKDATTYHPDGQGRFKFVDGRWMIYMGSYSCIHAKPYNGRNGWPCVDNLTVEYLGTTDRDIKGVVLSSFNAG